MYREMARITEMHRKWMEDPQYRKKYEALGEQFALAAAVIEARSRVGLTQQQLAKKMGTTQPAIARLESGRTPPVHAYLGAPCSGYRVASDHQVRAQG